MSAILNTVQVRCDWCGLFGPERPLAESGIIVETPLPEGWTGIGYGAAQVSPARYVELKDAYGTQINHLCPACSARPAGELITHLSAMTREKVS